MSDRPDDNPGRGPDVADDEEIAKMAAVMRASEKHREGGVVDPDLELTDADPDPDA